MIARPELAQHDAAARAGGHAGRGEDVVQPPADVALAQVAPRRPPGEQVRVVGVERAPHIDERAAEQLLEPLASDRAELDGNVAVKLSNMYATGNHHVYTASSDTHVLTGNPVVSVQKDEKGACKQTRSSTLTYRRSVDSISAEAISGIAGTETKPIPCPAELRH